jgi:hypothetical protein
MLDADYFVSLERGDAFHRLYLCEPAPIDAQLDELAAEYHERCEAYDRRVCTGPIVRGSIVPANPRELRLINTHAIAVLRELRSRAELHGFSPIQLFKAIQNHA